MLGYGTLNSDWNASAGAVVSRRSMPRNTTPRGDHRVRGVQCRLLIMAGSTPRRPEDQHHRTAAKRRDAHVLPRERRATGRGHRAVAATPVRGDAPQAASTQRQRAPEHDASTSWLTAAPPPRSTRTRSSISNHRMPRYSSAMRNGIATGHPHHSSGDLLIREQAQTASRRRVRVERMRRVPDDDRESPAHEHPDQDHHRPSEQRQPSRCLAPG